MDDCCSEMLTSQLRFSYGSSGDLTSSPCADSLLLQEIFAVGVEKSSSERVDLLSGLN